MHEFVIEIKKEPDWDFYSRRARAREILNSKDFLKPVICTQTPQKGFGDLQTMHQNPVCQTPTSSVAK
jgi:hypothetical protein